MGPLAGVSALPPPFRQQLGAGVEFLDHHSERKPEDPADFLVWKRRGKLQSQGWRHKAGGEAQSLASGTTPIPPQLSVDSGPWDPLTLREAAPLGWDAPTQDT